MAATIGGVWRVVAVTFLGVAACKSSPLGANDGGGGARLSDAGPDTGDHPGLTGGGGSGDAGPVAPGRFSRIFNPGTPRDLDILFMVDNSLSMQPHISKLTTSFPAFTDALGALPNGMPYLHIGVISS